MKHNLLYILIGCGLFRSSFSDDSVVPHQLVIANKQERISQSQLSHEAQAILAVLPLFNLDVLNINMDMIHGLDDQSIEQWRQCLVPWQQYAKMTHNSQLTAMVSQMPKVQDVKPSSINLDIPLIITLDHIKQQKVLNVTFSDHISSIKWLV
ncbi:MAG: hypothetical protein ACON5A_03315 [Candidatus Comchoanobacterales bacterium]